MQHMLALMALDQKGRENRESQTSLSQVLTRSNGIEPALQMEVPAGPYCGSDEVSIRPDNGTLDGKGDPAKGESAPEESMVKPTIASVFGETRLLPSVA